MFTRLNTRFGGLILDGTVADVGTQTGSPFSDAAGRLLLAMALFAVILYAVYLLCKHLFPKFGRSHGLMFGKNRNMKVLEITSVGQGSTIQLIKVSEEYFLIGVTKNSITFLTKTDFLANSIELADPVIKDAEAETKQGLLPFERYLSRLFVKKDVSAENSDEERK